MLKLNLGCGKNKIESAVNIDYDKSCSPDMIADVFKPLPFRDSSIDKVVMEHLINHCPKGKIVDFFEELYRICRPNAIIYATTPHFSNGVHGIACLEHYYYFASDTLDCLDWRKENHEVRPFKGKFEIESKLIMSKKYWRFLNVFNPLINRFRWFAERFFCKWIPIEDVDFTIRVIK